MKRRLDQLRPETQEKILRVRLPPIIASLKQLARKSRRLKRRLAIIRIDMGLSQEE